MKLLLTAINAKYIHSNLAVYSLQAYASEYKEHIKRAEYTINHHIDYILSGIYKEQPDVLLFSCYIWNIEYVRMVASEFHKLRPEVPIWVGGPEVSYEVKNFLRENDWATGIMIGEGEETFRRLCAYYVEQQSFDMLGSIAGIAYREEKADSVIHVIEPQGAMDMNQLPFVYDHISDFKNRIIYYETSRGCPFRCSYCLSSIEKSLRFRDIELVKKELAFFIAQEVPQVKFVDRTFNCDHDHAMAIWQFVKEHDKGITNFHFEIAADLLTEDEIAYIATMRPGLIQLEIGVQTTNPATIEEIHRRMDLGKVKEIVRRVKRPGNIHQHLDLIAGLPFEDYATFAQSFDEIYALKPQQLQLGFLKVLKGSYMYEHAKEYDAVFQSRPPYEVLQTRWLSYDDVLRIKQVEEMLEVYYNSAQFPMAIRMLETQFSSAFEMFAGLGEFYEEHGYFAMSHSRMRRVEILLEFARTIDEEHLAVYEQACTYDIYSRENAKSRPKWACDMADYKELTRSYCRGKVRHIEPFYYRFPDKQAMDEITELSTRLTEAEYLLFDYENRDILDHEAQITRVAAKQEEIH